MSWNEDFTFEYYTKLIDHMNDNYTMRYVSSYPSVRGKIGKKYLILRHDIDLDFSNACHMAELERVRGVKATYNFMLDHPFYDVSKNRRKLFRIQDCGHEVGLHYYQDLDSGVNSIGLEGCINSVNEQCERLEEIIESPVRSLSFHRVYLPLFRDYLMIGDRVNGSSRYMMENYISDSKGSWREGEPIQWLNDNHRRPVQVLIHPTHWGYGHKSTKERLIDIIEKEQERHRKKVENLIYKISDIKVWI